MLVVDITKGSPNYTLNLIFNSGVGSNLSISQNQFYDSIIQPSFPATVNGQSYTTGGNVTIAASEATGTFNGVGLWHNHSDFCAEILDLAVVNLS
jgi:hypothetical protein